ncbi:MBL fold metallo-hydrolase [Clostridium cadaveris]|uniref:MBL fold metallo-hydrolase n=1 Tax=Clostridium TaxID=1485 RepID=UPI001459E0BF|nr:MBL fold metallo-hydrolase [Clostridium cadaveris]MDU4951332.1 MBL fold metallo-hydrolase [Clostridium sp.]NME63825.1 MBL fold metallo-hydrolase [Clostridium cadaveris]
MIKVLATGSSGNCYLIKAKNETLILECGIAAKRILSGLEYDLKNVVGCLITHEHKDHCKAVNEILKQGINIYLSEGTAFGIEFKDILHGHRINYVSVGEQFKVGNFNIMPFDTRHDVNEPLGFLIQHNELGKIVFATDTFYLKSKFKDVDHVLIECNYSEEAIKDLPPYRARVLKSHMSLETLKETLSTWDLRKTKDITLIHISGDNGDPERFKREISRLTGIPTYVAEPGLEITDF